MYYNVKCLHYQNGDVQTRIYSNPVCIGAEKEGKKENKKAVKQTEEEKMRSEKCSLNRTKNSIYEIARANTWDWFFTLTFSAEKVDRFSYADCAKALSFWLKNVRKKCPGMVYLFVPEQHKDGAYHFHGLVSNVSELNFVDSGHLTKNKQTIYNIGNYKLGWSTSTEVQNTDAVGKYITKYISKQLFDSTKGKKRYWASKNVLRPVTEHFLLDGIESAILREELEEDCVSESFVVCKETKSNIQYFENNGIALSHEYVL